MYAKAHPFGYRKVKTLKVDRKDHTNESVKYVQTVRMPNGQTRAIKHYVIRVGSLI